MKAFWKIFLAAAGLALFGWYLSRVGLASVWATVVKIGPFAPLILIPYFVVYLVDCLAWALTLPSHSIPFLTLLRIRWAGESVNNLIPSAYVGGEALKVVLLREHGISATAGASSAVISKTAQSLGQLIFIVLASGFLFHLVKGDPAVRTGVALIIAGGTIVMCLLFAAQRFGTYRTVNALLKLVPIALPANANQKEKLLALDQTILAFYREKPGHFYRSTGLYLCGWLLDTVEIFLVAYLLGMPIDWTQALVIEAFAGVAKALGMWIPGSVGVQESGIVLVAGLAGVPATLGAAYALIRRARELVFAGIGLLIVYTGQTRKRRDETLGAARS